MHSKGMYIYLFIVYLLVSLFPCSGQPNRYPIVYLDLDGTALDTNGRVRPKTIAAVKEFKARGGRLGIATGRTLEQANEAIQALQPNLPVVLFNGGVTADPDGQNFRVIGNLDAETMQTCFSSLSHSTDIDGFILHFPSTSIPDRDSKNLMRIAKSGNITLTFRKDFKNISSDSLVKILILCPNEKTEMIRDTLQSKIPKTSRVVISSHTSVEVLPISITKAMALEKIASRYAFSLEKVVAFGDSGNDVEMLSSVGFGIAMCNGRPETLEAADIIVGPNYSDAIAKFLTSSLIKCLR